MKFVRRVFFIVAVLAASAAAGWTASRLHVPLAWMIGPLLLVGAGTIILDLPQLPKFSRYSGQVIIGGSVGLYLTPQAMERVLANAAPILLGTLLMTILACIISLVQIRLSRIDPATAIFSNIPGGPLDMAIMAESHGGDPARTAAYQTVRIATVVLFFPPVIMFTSAEIFPRVTEYGGWGDSAVLLLIGTIGALAANRMRIMNPFFIGPLLAVGALTAGGMGLAPYHDGVVPAAQVLFGATLGGMFQRRTFEQAGRFMISLIATTVTLLAGSIGVAELLILLFGGDFATMALSNAPAAVAEMVITAQVLRLDVPLVASFQVVRVVLGLFLGGLFFHIYMRFHRSRKQG